MEILPNIYERNRRNYCLLLTLSILFIAISAYTHATENFVLAIPTLTLTLIAFVRKEKLYIPPMFIALLAVTMVALQITKFYNEKYQYLTFIADASLGFFVSLLGFMVILSMLKSSPSFDVERPFFVSFTAFCIASTLTMFIFIVNATLDVLVFGGGDWQLGLQIWDLLVTIIGAAFVSILFYLNRHNNVFKHTVDKFLSDNADTLQIENRERELVLKEIEEGESSKLEFKSTLRTNLKTGEKDPRMEKAVLKTLVAFLNSRGGTLLIGVADDGTILGVDVESFDNSRDKFGLHLNNIITKQIGSEFLPFINYKIVDFDGKAVMRVNCIRSDRPVFLDDGKEQTFYVRSGPSSIDLHGLDLLYYANHNFGKSLKKI